MKKLLLAMILLPMLIFTACGADDTTPTTAQATPTPTGLPAETEAAIPPQGNQTPTQVVDDTNPLVIPYGVTHIERHEFANGQFTSVIIPDTVTHIGHQAFFRNYFTSVTIPDSVTYIGQGAFSNNRLTSITIPDSVTNIGIGAFSNNRLTSVIIPDSVTSIPPDMFANNPLTSVSIPDNITSIGHRAFQNNQLANVTIPDSVEHIWDYAFANNQLTSVTIPDSVMTISTSAFANNQLTNVTLPDGGTSIRGYAFANNQLTNIIIPDSIRQIDAAAFIGNPLDESTTEPEPANNATETVATLSASLLEGTWHYVHRTYMMNFPASEVHALRFTGDVLIRGRLDFGSYRRYNFTLYDGIIARECICCGESHSDIAFELRGNNLYLSWLNLNTNEYVNRVYTRNIAMPDIAHVWVQFMDDSQFIVVTESDRICPFGSHAYDMSGNWIRGSIDWEKPVYSARMYVSYCPQGERNRLKLINTNVFGRPAWWPMGSSTEIWIVPHNEIILFEGGIQVIMGVEYYSMISIEFTDSIWGDTGVSQFLSLSSTEARRAEILAEID